MSTTVGSTTASRLVVALVGLLTSTSLRLILELLSFKINVLLSRRSSTDAAFTFIVRLRVVVLLFIIIELILLKDLGPARRLRSKAAFREIHFTVIIESSLLRLGRSLILGLRIPT